MWFTVPFEVKLAPAPEISSDPPFRLSAPFTDEAPPLKLSVPPERVSPPLHWRLRIRAVPDLNSTTTEPATLMTTSSPVAGATSPLQFAAVPHTPSPPPPSQVRVAAPAAVGKHAKANDQINSGNNRAYDVFIMIKQRLLTIG